MKSLCNTRVSGWNPDTLKEIVHFVHEVHPIFAVTLSTLLHILCGWNDDTMQPFNLFRVQFQGFIAEKISKCMKNNKWSQKGLKIDDVALNGAFWTQKKSGVQISWKNEIPL